MSLCRECSKCGYNTPIGLRRCVGCGHDFGQSTFDNPPAPAKVREELESMDTHDQTEDPDVDAIFGRPAPTKYNAKELVEVLTKMGGPPTFDIGSGFATAKWTNSSEEMLLKAWCSGLHVLAHSLTTGDKELTVFLPPEAAPEVE